MKVLYALIAGILGLHLIGYIVDTPQQGLKALIIASLIIGSVFFAYRIAHAITAK